MSPNHRTYYNFSLSFNTGCLIWNGTKVKHYCDHVFRVGILSFQIYGPKMRTFCFLKKSSTKRDFGFWPIFFEKSMWGYYEVAKFMSKFSIFDSIKQNVR